MKYKIQKWHRQGLWDNKKVADAVAKNMITAEDYAEITGGVYPG